MSNNKKFIGVIIPIMLAFFAMGAVDMVGIASNYVKEDLQLSDTIANLLPSMVFLWFFVLSVPTGLLMNKIGRQKTVLISLAVTVAALVCPLLAYIPGISSNVEFAVMLAAFALLGIGNTIMQVSLNPLISNIVSDEKFASTLTFGQFVKAIASFGAPFIASFVAVKFGDWKLLFPIYAAFTALALILLSTIKIEEQPYTTESNFGKSLALLKNPAILLFFFGIMAHVGIDVGINTTAPKILDGVNGMDLKTGGMFGLGAGFATSIYFIFRMLGCFSGSFILAKSKHIYFWLVSVIFMALSVIGFLIFKNEIMLYVCLALVGFGNSNIFPMVFTKAVQTLPERGNEVSGLMIMGIVSGAIFPLLMGVASDAMNSQAGAVIVTALLVVYLFCLSGKIK
jgi:fucose permease